MIKKALATYYTVERETTVTVAVPTTTVEENLVPTVSDSVTTAEMTTETSFTTIDQMIVQTTLTTVITATGMHTCSQLHTSSNSLNTLQPVHINHIGAICIHCS